MFLPDIRFNPNKCLKKINKLIISKKYKDDIITLDSVIFVINVFKQNNSNSCVLSFINTIIPKISFNLEEIKQIIKHSQNIDIAIKFIQQYELNSIDIFQIFFLFDEDRLKSDFTLLIYNAWTVQFHTSQMIKMLQSVTSERHRYDIMCHIICRQLKCSKLHVILNFLTNNGYKCDILLKYITFYKNNISTDIMQIHEILSSFPTQYATLMLNKHLGDMIGLWNNVTFTSLFNQLFDDNDKIKMYTKFIKSKNLILSRTDDTDSEITDTFLHVLRNVFNDYHKYQLLTKFNITIHSFDILIQILSLIHDAAIRTRVIEIIEFTPTEKLDMCDVNILLDLFRKHKYKKQRVIKHLFDAKWCKDDVHVPDYDPNIHDKLIKIHIPSDIRGKIPCVAPCHPTTPQTDDIYTYSINIENGQYMEIHRQHKVTHEPNNYMFFMPVDNDVIVLDNMRISGCFKGASSSGLIGNTLQTIIGDIHLSYIV